MVKFKVTGNFKHTEDFFHRMLRMDPMSILEKYGQKGVVALSNATPEDTGKTKDSWSYNVTKTAGGYELSFDNSNNPQGVPIVILLQYGHGTRNGGYVQGRDFINPALSPIFDELEQELGKEVNG